MSTLKIFQMCIRDKSYTLLTDENGAFTLPALAPGDYQLLISLPGDCIPADGNTAVLTDGFWTSDVHIDSGSQLDLTYAVLRYARAAGHVWSMDCLLYTSRCV